MSANQLERIEKVTVSSGQHIELKSILGVSATILILIQFQYSLPHIHI
jgi:hypothetical protein